MVPILLLIQLLCDFRQVPYPLSAISGMIVLLEGCWFQGDNSSAVLSHQGSPGLTLYGALTSLWSKGSSRAKGR